MMVGGDRDQNAQKVCFGVLLKLQFYIAYLTVLPDKMRKKDKFMAEQPYDALLIVSFGGPEGMNDVMPFLENVLRGRNVPRERMIEVSHHYAIFGGVSPINQQNRDLI